MKVREHEQELDYVERQVRDYILENQKRRLTVNQVAVAMKEKGVCARMTTLKKIETLKDRSIIEDIRDKPNNFSWLIVKDKNEFSKISSQLTEIESLIKTIDEPTRKINQLTMSNDPSAADYYGNFLFPYIESISTMLRVLLIRTDEIIKSNKDCQNLHKRIIELMTKLTLQSYGMNNASHLLLTVKLDLNSKRKWLRSAGARKSLFTLEMIDKLVKTIDDFETSFLPLPTWFKQLT